MEMTAVMLWACLTLAMTGLLPLALALRWLMVAVNNRPAFSA